MNNAPSHLVMEPACRWPVATARYTGTGRKPDRQRWFRGSNFEQRGQLRALEEADAYYQPLSHVGIYSTGRPILPLLTMNAV